MICETDKAAPWQTGDRVRIVLDPAALLPGEGLMT
jgi:hypothetical protein